MIEKDTFKLKADATVPIRGGPNKKPKNPMVETAASATQEHNGF
jgi:hypothetical protein